MTRYLSGSFLAIGFVLACGGSPDDRPTQKTAEATTRVALADTLSITTDSSAREADLSPELAPFVGPLAVAWTGDLDSWSPGASSAS